jgi:hypothetical protein
MTVAVAAIITEDGGWVGWGTSIGIEFEKNWKRFDSSLMLGIRKERKKQYACSKSHYLYFT